MTGKPEFQNVKYEDYKDFSSLYQINEQYKITRISAGMDHILMMDNIG